ncbi:hypothetical protein EDL98_09355 [Ornithobacterium rhinotracheale]|uniref:hypothetical protein n=1 Tax=Ornithobacterium rhinotracheale TaxID=28251 RepID=UPI00129CD7B4|nr:hypothetical protein [Ornithobacterium rhinotracheale]MRJ11279.1 hypothetical protein [Ornithobacterium rhinotracheale]
MKLSKFTKYIICVFLLLWIGEKSILAKVHTDNLEFSITYKFLVKQLEKEGGLAKLPKDENGNYLLDIEVNGEKVPVLVGENSSLDKIDLQVSSLDNLASKPYWSKEDKALFNKTFNTPTIESAKSWTLLKEANRTGLMQNTNAIDILTKARLNPNISKLGITDEALAKIKGFRGTSFEDVIKQLDEFANNALNKNIQLNDFDKVVNQLQQGGSKSEGANWIVEYLSKNADEFKGKKIVFEEYNNSVLGGRFVDVTVCRQTKVY